MSIEHIYCILNPGKSRVSFKVVQNQLKKVFFSDCTEHDWKQVMRKAWLDPFVTFHMNIFCLSTCAGRKK